MALRVLVVDDSASMRAAGFAVSQCLEASDGQTALEMLRGQAVDLVLSDLHMPRMDGVALLRALKQEGLVPRYFILVTTEGRKECLKEALSLGARGFVKKPFHSEALRKILSLFLGEPDPAQAEQDGEGLDF